MARYIFENKGYEGKMKREAYSSGSHCCDAKEGMRSSRGWALREPQARSGRRARARGWRRLAQPYELRPNWTLARLTSLIHYTKSISDALILL